MKYKELADVNWQTGELKFAVCENPDIICEICNNDRFPVLYVRIYENERFVESFYHVCPACAASRVGLEFEKMIREVMIQKLRN